MSNTYTLTHIQIRTHTLKLVLYDNPHIPCYHPSTIEPRLKQNSKWFSFLNDVSSSVVGRHWPISRLGGAPKGHPDVMAPHHCQALPHTAVRVLKPKHPGGSSRGSADSADYSCITVVHQPDFSTCWFPQQDIVAAIELPCRFLDPEPSSYPCSWANHAPHHSHLSEHLCLNISPWFTRSPF